MVREPPRERVALPDRVEGPLEVAREGARVEEPGRAALVGEPRPQRPQAPRPRERDREVLKVPQAVDGE